MLTQIELANFKCFKEKTFFPLGQLTLLTGINGCGKSTFLQSLLLMRQSIEHNDSASQVVLNGSCVNLGSFKDIKNSSISRNELIKFIYSYKDKHILYPNQENNLKLHGYAEYNFEENFEDDMVAQISNITFSSKVTIHIDKKESAYEFEAVYKKIEDGNILNINRFDFNEVTRDKIAVVPSERKGSCGLLNLLPLTNVRPDFNNLKEYSLSLDVFSLHKSLYFYNLCMMEDVFTMNRLQDGIGM